MSFLKQILNVSNESADQEETGLGSSNDGAVIETRILEIEADGAETVVALEEEAAQLDQLELGTDVVSANVDVVEDIQEEAVRQVEASPDRTLSEESYAIMRVALEGIANNMYLGNVGFKSYSHNVSVEDFRRGTTTRKNATQVALEAADETKKSLWRRFLDLLSSLWNKIKYFFKWIFSAKERMRRRVKLAKDVIADSGNHEIDADKISGINDLIGKGGVTEASEDVGSIFGVMDKQLTHTKRCNGAMVSYQREVVDSVSKGSAAFIAAQEKAYSVVSSSEQLIGGKVVQGTEEYIKADKEKRNFGLLSLKDPKDTKEKTFKGKVKINELGNALERVFAMFEANVKSVDEYSKFLKDFKSSLESALKNEDKAISNASRAALANVKWFSPSKFTSTIMRMCNMLANNILKNAPKEAKEKNEKEIEKDAKEKTSAEAPAAA